MAELISKQYLDLILKGLSELAYEVSWRGRLNLTDLHIMSEDFYAGFLNIVYGLSLRNTNITNQNSEGIDLEDDNAKIIIQVSSTCTKNKIEHSLNEIVKCCGYQGYHFRFLPLIVGAASYHKKQTYNVPSGITFNPKDDIIDVPTILKELQSDLSGQKLEDAADFIRRNLHTSSLVCGRLASGLEYVIVQLSKDGSVDSVFDTTEYRIESKISFNGLSYGQDIINEYANHYPSVKRIYDEYDQQGQIKSKSVLQKLHNIYLRFKHDYKGDELFKKIEKEICNNVNANNMPGDFTQEELEMCAEILMVHAFMECNIFEKPV